MALLLSLLALFRKNNGMLHPTPIPLRQIFVFFIFYLTPCLVLGQSPAVLWESAPADHQLYPRNLSSNLADVWFKGELLNPAALDSLVLHTFDSRGQDSTTKLSINRDGVVEHRFTITSGLHHYNFSLKAYSEGLEQEIYQARDVVAGDAYLIYGQSNAQAGRSRHDLSPYIRSFNRKKVNGDTLLTWEARADNQDNHLLIDALPGDFGQRFAHRIITEYGIPVAIINGAVGGQIIDDLLPIDSHQITRNNMYKDWNTRVIRAGLSNHIRAIVWHQGESDGLHYNCRDVTYYKDRFSLMKAAWEKDFPNFKQIYMFQSQACTGFGITPHCMIQIQEAQRQLAQEDEKINILATGHYQQLMDGCHYPTYQYQQMGDALFGLANYDLYRGRKSMPAHLDIENIAFANVENTSISLTLTGQVTQVNKEYLRYLRFEEDSMTQVVDAKILNQNQLLLFLNKRPDKIIPGLSHMSAIIAGNPLVANETTSLLQFYHQRVTPFQLDKETLIPTYLLYGPNPVNNELMLWWELDEPLSFQLLNANGKSLEKGAVQRGATIISFRKHDEGVYFLRLLDKTTDATHTIKLKKQ